MRILAAALALGLFAMLGALPATADDWKIVKLRGTVVEFVEGEWQRLERGDVVPDDRVIRTLGGRVTLVRGGETIDLGSNTQIQIFDEEARRPFTTVKQHFGTVGIEAEVRDVQHFAVQTPYLIAVIKGTRFVVTSGDTSSEVKVQRGAVEVNGTGSDTHTVIVAGQSAAAGLKSSMPQATR
jgi:ferric-dicitrate binding protein FerR (iron transport regulator)